MSLTSRLTNLFSGSTKSQQDSSSLGLIDDGLSGAGGNFTGTRFGAKSLGPKETMAQEADEEEARPPYLHVSLSESLG